MKSKLEILAVEHRSGKSRKTNENYNMTICQCVLRKEKVNSQTGALEENIKVGELIIPKGMPDPVPGEYLGEFEMTVDFNKQIGAQLVSLVPFGKSVLKPQSKAV